MSRYSNSFLQLSKQDKQSTYKCNIEARSRNHHCSISTISTKYYECVTYYHTPTNALIMSFII
jgi:hypothetical protein